MNNFTYFTLYFLLKIQSKIIVLNEIGQLVNRKGFEHG